MLPALPVRLVHPAASAAAAPREWLVANGLGGYACGPLTGLPIRRYHGWLVAALPPPRGRTMLVNRVVETVHLADGGRFSLGAGQDDDAELEAFRLEGGLPHWRFRHGPCVVERALVMEHGRNVTHVRWRVLEGPCRKLALTPWLQARPHGAAVDAPLIRGRVRAEEGRLAVAFADFPAIHFRWHSPGGRATEADASTTLYYANEAEGGDPAEGPLWSPGHLACPLDLDHPAHLSVGIQAADEGDPWGGETRRRRHLLGRAHPALRRGVAAELVLAADSFVVEPRYRQGAGDDRAAARSIIAGYRWFADWGRDTMIALEGLTLLTGRADDARAIVEGFAAHLQDGLIPNMFPDGEARGQYNTADASLWFCHAVDRVHRHTGDDAFLRRMVPAAAEIVARHRQGTRFGIAQDPADGLLRQGEAGLQLTWMDAKAGDWVVTPRRGKAVEINALWYNALACLAGWQQRLAGDSAAAEAEAARVHASFNRRFWSDRLGYLRDVVDGEDGDDDSLRPNQLLAISLPHAALAPERWPLVLERVRARLLTPVGLRSLSPDHPDYHPRFEGDRCGRDGAYHQGTAWAWLIGPFVTAWLRAYPHDAVRAQAWLEGLAGQLDQFGLGSIGEVFDGAPPHRPRGCIAQAWSVGEWLRAHALCRSGGKGQWSRKANHWLNEGFLQGKGTIG